MTPKELEIRQSKIDKLVKKTASEANAAKDDLLPIFDGIADEEGYLSSKLKVAWILKEPYDEIDENGEPRGGGWSLAKDCFNSDKLYTGNNPVWQKIAYVMYGFNHNESWEKMTYIHDKPEMMNVIRSIAWINISKMPAKTSSNNSQIQKNYNDVWREVILKQLDFYEPDVIIFGNTFNCLKNDSQPNRFQYAEKDEKLSIVISADYKWSLGYWRLGKQRLISAYHPGRKGEGGDYVSPLLEALKQAEKELKQ